MHCRHCERNRCTPHAVDANSFLTQRSAAIAVYRGGIVRHILLCITDVCCYAYHLVPSFSSQHSSLCSASDYSSDESDSAYSIASLCATMMTFHAVLPLTNYQYLSLSSEYFFLVSLSFPCVFLSARVLVICKMRLPCNVSVSLLPLLLRNEHADEYCYSAYASYACCYHLVYCYCGLLCLMALIPLML